MTINQLETKATKLRKLIVKIACSSDCGHITSSLSCLDILNALYLGKILRYESNNQNWLERDRFVASKGHASLALYCVLREVGFINREFLLTYGKPGSHLGGSLSLEVPGVDWHTGSLGHGLSAGVGFALAAKIQKSDRLVFVLTGDGELDEGSNWEAALSASQLALNNLVWIVDKNNIQCSGSVSDIVSLEPLGAKLSAFGFDVKTISGHNYNEIMKTLSIDRDKLPAKPLAVIANTIKGNGIPLVENKLDWHNRKPNEEELKLIIRDFGITREEYDAL
ncbi:MAG: transketolase [Clostridiales bacterium]|jgi:transketolase|nr:transketolase [Clostridiales bacterium]